MTGAQASAIEPRSRKLGDAISHVAPAENAHPEHLSRCQFRLKCRVKISSFWLNQPIHIIRLHLVIYHDFDWFSSAHWPKIKQINNKAMNQLTPEERHIIEDKGTEAPFSGEYNDHFENGLYQCKRCNAYLFRSEDKFKSGCGWPSFDDAIPGAVREQADADGRRTEIVCNNCGAHLGHVFRGERQTEKDTRHCVNSLSMKFVPSDQIQIGTAIFAAGCFWGVEYYFQKAPGVLKTTVGYTGGSTPNPTYEQVCQGQTGHYEAIKVYYDPNVTDFEALTRLFFNTHDPTQENGQGPDIGMQYQSAIFYEIEDEKKTAEKLIEELQKKGLTVATRVLPSADFWPAEDCHQDYYQKNGKEPYCHVFKDKFA